MTLAPLSEKGVANWQFRYLAFLVFHFRYIIICKMRKEGFFLCWHQAVSLTDTEFYTTITVSLAIHQVSQNFFHKGLLREVNKPCAHIHIKSVYSKKGSCIILPYLILCNTSVPHALEGKLISGFIYLRVFICCVLQIQNIMNEWVIYNDRTPWKSTR